MKILCVDEDSAFLDNIVKMCRELPQIDEVTGFADPGSAMKWTNNNFADIALLNINMPKNYDLFPDISLRKMNPYMQDEKSFKKLQELLKTRFDDIEYRVGNIMEVNNLDNELFDIYTKLKDHLTDEGVLQLLYHYAFTRTSYPDGCASRNLVKILNTVFPDVLEFSEFDNSHKDGKDCAIYYRKKR